jgi:O-antigen/teichoic acid export membrane protein
VILRNLISAFTVRLFVALCNLSILLITSRTLGSEVLGLLSLLVVNITVIQTLLDVYSGPALVHFLPRNDLRRIYRFGIIWILTGVFLLNLLFSFFEVSAPGYRLHLLILSALSTFNAFHLVLILAREKVKTYNLLVFLQPATLLAALLAVIYVFNTRSLSSNIISMYCAWGCCLVFSSLVVFGLMRAEKMQSERTAFKTILRNGLINQVGNLAHILSNRYNYYVLAAAAVVGVYAAATSLIESAWIISISISPLVLTYVANRSSQAGSAILTFTLAKICFLISAACVFVLFVIPASFFGFLLGEEFSELKKIMLYLAPGVLCISFSSILSHYFSARGRQRILLIANCGGLAVTLLCSYIFISAFGMLGACYTATLAYFTQSLVLTIIFVRENNFTVSDFFRIGKHLKDLGR